MSGSRGSSARKGDRLILHITPHPSYGLYQPLGCKVKSAKLFIDGTLVKFDQWKHGVQLQLPETTESKPAMVIELTSTDK